MDSVDLKILNDVKGVWSKECGISLEEYYRRRYPLGFPEHVVSLLKKLKDRSEFLKKRRGSYDNG